MTSPSMRLQSYVDTEQLHRQKSTDAETQNVRGILAGAKVRRLCTNRQALKKMNHVFSHKLDTWVPTDQHRTGRCWIHASLNVLKARWMHKYPNLELSPCYVSFFDKLERANTVLQRAKRMRDLSMDHREMVSLLTDMGTDGGQWNMFIQLVEKYGVVPKWSMDDTLSDKDSNDVNNVIADLVVATVFDIRRHPPAQADASIQQCLEDIYHVLYVHFGEPPALVNLRWNEKQDDDNGKRKVGDAGGKHRVRNGNVVDKGWVRPQDLFRSICPESLGKHYLMLCNDPRHEYGQLFRVEGVTSTVEGDALTYLNVSSRTMMDAVFHSIVHHEQPVWFTCDVDKQFHRGRGVMDSELYMPERLYRLDKSAFAVSKQERLECRRSMPTHAMVFTGVDVERDPHGQSHVSKWRVENSWGKEGRGDAKGFIAMSNEWFHEYVFQVVIDTRVLDRRMVEYAQSASPITLKPWDVFGTVAR